MQVKENYKFPHKIYSTENPNKENKLLEMQEIADFKTSCIPLDNQAKLEAYKTRQKRKQALDVLKEMQKIHPSLVGQSVKKTYTSILEHTYSYYKPESSLKIGYKRLIKISRCRLAYKIKNQSMDIGFFQAIILMPEKTFETLVHNRKFITDNTIDTKYLWDFIKKVEEFESKKITITLKHTITESIVISPGYSNFTKDESQHNLPKPKKPQRSETADIWLIIKQFLMGVATGFFIGSGIIFIALVMKQIINRIENHDFLAR